MKVFADQGPRVFHVPATEDFAASLASGLRSRLPRHAPPEAMARVVIFTNTRRAERSLLDAIRQEFGSQGFLPQIRILGELGDAALPLDAPPPVDPFIRTLRLTRIVRDILEMAGGKLGPVSAAPALAGLVASMADELQEHDIDIGALDGVADPEHAVHWQVSRLLLQTAQQQWREWATANLGGALDPADHQKRALDAQIASWERDQPDHPVIAAGSTASRPGAARLMRAIARLPQGAVVLPGFDPEMDADARRRMTADHPQSGMLRFVESLDLSPGAIRSWRDIPDQSPESEARRRLVAEALRPAPVTDKWRANSAQVAALASSATAALTLVEAPDPRREAEAAALAIRETLSEPGARVALVTPDRTLARRVAAELERAGVEVDDSGGRPLSLTPPGVFLRLLADWAAARESGRRAALGLLALLKHPMCADGPGRGAHLAAARTLEIAVLRSAAPAVSFARMRDALRAWAGARESRLRRADAACAMLERFEAAVAPIAGAGDPAPLSAQAAAHRAAAGALSSLGAPERTPSARWRDPDAEAVLERLSALESAGWAFGETSATDYALILAGTLSAEAAREPARNHPRLAIYGPLEARMQRADRVILAGLDEGIWPEPPRMDPWFSRPMRQAAGLPELERRLGLSAHDFAQNMGAPEVILTRALKRDGAATVASRWVQRLTNLLKGAAPDSLAEMRARGEALLNIAEAGNRASPAAPAPRPRPTPPVEARPSRLSVTRIESLVRDPYAIYAERVLRLKAVDPIGRPPDARERGSAIHRVFELFSLGIQTAGAADLAAIWAASVDEALTDLAAWPAQQALWRRRLDRIAPWFLSTEAERQALGRTVGVEIAGMLPLPMETGEFTLTAKADRIDLLSGEGYAIYDYKTGAAPSEKQVAAFAKQLPLEAAIAEAGGFDGLPPRPAAKLAYLRIGGDGAENPVDRKTPAGAQAAASLAELQRLLAAYDDPATPYTSRARPESIRHESDYDHLARVAEWSAGDDEGGDA